MSWEHVHRMLVGGPLDNTIVYVQVNIDPYQFTVTGKNGQTLMPPSPRVTPGDVIAAGRYHKDEFYWGNGHHQFFRFEDMGRKCAAKIYMRRMGASLYDIYHKVEWETWFD